MTFAVGDPAWFPVVAIDEGALAGMALMCANPVFFGDALEVLDLTFFVHPDRRGSMAARAMLEAIDGWARAIGAVRVTIAPNTGIDHDRTTRFFRILGFEKTGEAMTKRIG